MSSTVNQINDLTQQEYKWGFVTSIDEDRLPPWAERRHRSRHFREEERAGVHAGVAAEGVSALADLEQKKRADWANVKYPPIDYQNISYYSAPKQKKELKSLDEVDPKFLRRTRSWAFRCRAEAAGRRGGGRGV